MGHGAALKLITEFMLFSGCPQAAARLCQDVAEMEAACCAERGGGGGGGGEDGTRHESHGACGSSLFKIKGHHGRRTAYSPRPQTHLTPHTVIGSSQDSHEVVGSYCTTPDGTKSSPSSVATASSFHRRRSLWMENTDGWWPALFSRLDRRDRRRRQYGDGADAGGSTHAGRTHASAAVAVGGGT